jgi:hypothetical protein
VKRTFLALLAGIAITAVALTVFIQSRGNAISLIVLWPLPLLARFVPHGNIGTAEHPVYEGSPLDLFAALIGLAVSGCFYGGLVYAILVWRAHRREQINPGRV